MTGSPTEYLCQLSCARARGYVRVRVYSRRLNFLRECAKPRGVYAASALATLSKKLEHDVVWATEQLQAACDDDSVYTCGAHPFPSTHSLAQHVYCNDTLTCASLVEGALYTSNATTLNKIASVFDVTLCSECGVQQLSKERCDEIGCASGQVSQWKHWPLCSACGEEGRSLTVRKRARPTRASAKESVVTKKRKLSAAQRRDGLGTAEAADTSDDDAGEVAGHASPATLVFSDRSGSSSGGFLLLR